MFSNAWKVRDFAPDNMDYSAVDDEDVDLYVHGLRSAPPCHRYYDKSAGTAFATEYTRKQSQSCLWSIHFVRIEPAGCMEIEQ